MRSGSGEDARESGLSEYILSGGDCETVLVTDSGYEVGGRALASAAEWARLRGGRPPSLAEAVRKGWIAPPLAPSPRLPNAGLGRPGRRLSAGAGRRLGRSTVHSSCDTVGRPRSPAGRRPPPLEHALAQRRWSPAGCSSTSCGIEWTPVELARYQDEPLRDSYSVASALVELARPALLRALEPFPGAGSHSGCASPRIDGIPARPRPADRARDLRRPARRRRQEEGDPTLHVDVSPSAKCRVHEQRHHPPPSKQGDQPLTLRAPATRRRGRSLPGPRRA